MTMRNPDGLRKLALAACLFTTAFLLISVSAWGVTRLIIRRQQAGAQVAASSSNPAIGGFPIAGRPAPDFKLTDQFGQSVTLSSLRGREVVLAFIDARCKSLCPLTAEIMYDARARLGSSASSRIALVAVNANPAATGITEVQSWSIQHGMLHQWLFLTGAPQQLQSIYHQYQVYDQVSQSNGVVHDPATFIIDAQGREQLFFETLSSNSKADLSSQVSGLVAGMRQWLPGPR
jgi:cytochrome oxidase Cu insertion factor (SCO1/SenC/PrrC family)